MSFLKPAEQKPMSETKQLQTLRIITLAMLLGGPLMYLYMAYLGSQHETARDGQVMLYVLFLVSLITPPMAVVVERSQIKLYKNGSSTQTTPAAMFQTISIIKMAMINAVYIYGFVAANLTGEFTNMFYFYPIGMIWSLVYWPTGGRFERLKEKLNTP